MPRIRIKEISDYRVSDIDNMNFSIDGFEDKMQSIIKMLESDSDLKEETPLRWTHLLKSMQRKRGV